MSRILAIDYGGKRCGIAVTDPLQIIASGLATVQTNELLLYLQQYFEKEAVEKVVIGEPKNLRDEDTNATPLVHAFIKTFENKFPNTPIIKVDERYTSKIATRAMLEMGLKKKERRNKSLVDEISATIILQEYLTKS
ncbi:MAG TPA: Holliday junction resolvase RuvX [Chitinophagaceae bacterium]|nr:Holliday junction resolvase RuvX [Chitinophagaceae bacterium]